LTNEPDGLEISELCKKYYQMNGVNLPWKELGFADAIEVIRHFDYVLKIRRDGRTDEFVVYDKITSREKYMFDSPGCSW
jgi:hypothetical protein